MTLMNSGSTIANFTVSATGLASWSNPGSPTGGLVICDETTGYSAQLSATATSYQLPVGDWNVGDKVLLGRYQNTFTATIPAATTPPTLVTPPATSGSFVVGDVLTTTEGTFSGTPTPSEAITWGRTQEQGEPGQVIAGATGTTYTLQPADVGYEVYSVVTASNSAGTAIGYGWTETFVTAAPPTNVDICQATVTPAELAADGNLVMSKLYQGFGVYTSTTAETPPQSVSGRYSCLYYVPSGFQVPTNSAVNTFQWKIKYGQNNQNNQSDPIWWLNFSTGSWAQGIGGATWVGPGKPSANMGNNPAMFLDCWGKNGYSRNWSNITFMVVPLDQWFGIEVNMVQGSPSSLALSILTVVNGTLVTTPFQTVYSTEYPITPQDLAATGLYTNGEEWTWGIGNYASCANTLYMAHARFAPASPWSQSASQYQPASIQLGNQAWESDFTVPNLSDWSWGPYQAGQSGEQWGTVVTTTPVAAGVPAPPAVLLAA